MTSSIHRASQASSSGSCVASSSASTANNQAPQAAASDAYERGQSSRRFPASHPPMPDLDHDDESDDIGPVISHPPIAELDSEDDGDAVHPPLRRPRANRASRSADDVQGMHAPIARHRAGRPTRSANDVDSIRSLVSHPPVVDLDSEGEDDCEHGQSSASRPRARQAAGSVNNGDSVGSPASPPGVREVSEGEDELRSTRSALSRPLASLASNGAEAVAGAPSCLSQPADIEAARNPHDVAGMRMAAFTTIFYNEADREQFLEFLRSVYVSVDPARFSRLIDDLLAHHRTYESFYNALTQRMSEAQDGGLRGLQNMRASLTTLQRQLAQQTASLLTAGAQVDGYAEIGYCGRLINPLRRQQKMRLAGDRVIVCASQGMADYLEAGMPRPHNKFVRLDEDYTPLTPRLSPASLDLILCPIGLHHCPQDRLEAFVRSIAEVLRPGGSFVLREHDGNTAARRRMAEVVHSVFNASTGVPYDDEQAEIRNFQPLGRWVDVLAAAGLRPDTTRPLQHLLQP
ncbi:MAG: class I SAM-dependent methyltransferase, partial [Deltaproteobacteria bacterium]